MKELFNVLCMEDAALGMYLRVALKKHYKKVYSDGDNYLYVKGASTLCLVAHIDTVRGKIDAPVKLSLKNNVIRNTKGILGADDRAGVFGILTIMRKCEEENLPMPSIIFTNYEERGGKGVKAFIKDKKFDPRGIDLFVELDRKGCNEYVFYSTTLPIQVKDYVESFGFREERGSYSDISDLTDEYLIPSVNVSIGYYAQHTCRESLHYDEMMMTVERVMDMVATPIDKRYPVPKPVYRYYGSGKNWEDSYYAGSSGSKSFNAPVTVHGNKNSTGISTNPPATTPAEKLKTALTVVSKQSETQGKLNFQDDVAKQVIMLLFIVKEEIKTELITIYNLDTVAEKFLTHEHSVAIIDKLETMLEMYIELVTSDIIGVRAFQLVWSELIDKEWDKLTAKAKAA